VEHKLHMRLWTFVYVANHKINVITDVGIAHSVWFPLCVRHIAGHKWRDVF